MAYLSLQFMEVDRIHAFATDGVDASEIQYMDLVGGLARPCRPK
jgi:hypothetical protein